MSRVTSPTNSSFGGFFLKVDCVGQLEFKQEGEKDLIELNQHNTCSDDGAS